MNYQELINQSLAAKGKVIEAKDDQVLSTNLNAMCTHASWCRGYSLYSGEENGKVWKVKLTF